MLFVMALKINLGCGRKYFPEWITAMSFPQVKADKYFNLNQPPYPWSQVARRILLDNVLEHLEDIPRIRKTASHLQTGGVVKIHVPYGKTDWALQDPTSPALFHEKSMNYFCDDDR